MLTIGLFAQVGQVTVQTLRHYDRLGLLKPSQVDRFTNWNDLNNIAVEIQFPVAKQ